ncbi:MAG: SGNH/GDSL hydrolase family protein [Verrucomicrobiota bacterium]
MTNREVDVKLKRGMGNHRLVAAVWLLFLAVMLSCVASDKPPRLALKSDDRVVFIGNTFAERLTSHGYFEAMLASRFPELKLTLRNLGFSGDEAVRGLLGTGAGPGTIGPLQTNTWLQLRALNFGEIFSHIEEQRADVIVACYGMNESFAGTAGRSKFEKDLTTYLSRLVELKCGAAKSSPRLVLVSPIPHEDLGGDLPEPVRHNEDLRAYTEAMRRVAAAMNLPFIDLFNPVKPILDDKSGSPLTFNGIHLTRYGNWVVAQIMMDQLGFTPAAVNLAADAAGLDNVALPQLELASLPIAPPPADAKVHRVLIERLPLVKITGLLPGTYKLRISGHDAAKATAADLAKGIHVSPPAEASENLAAAVDDKNWEFFMKYRAVNGEYIYGRRKEPFGVVNFPKEREFQEQLVAEMDARIHELAKSLGPLKVELLKADK